VNTQSQLADATFANPFQMNDWRIAAALKTSVALYLVTWAFIGLDAVGLHVPLVRGLFAIVSLLFVPGILILRVLRVHRLGSARTVLFAVGLSVATVMFTGIFINFVYPLVGVARPFALLPAVGTMTTFVALLAVASYWRDRDFADHPRISAQEVSAPSALILCILPFIVVLGSFLMNAYHSNLGLLGALVVIGATAFWVSTSASFPKRLYPFAVFTIALALIYYGSLVSFYVWGWDIQKELYHANLVLTNGVWNPALPDVTNAVISVTMLAPMLAQTSGLSLVWLFKLVYPLLFALVPLGLFVAVQKQTNDKIAFLAAFFVSFLFTFFSEMPALARQEVAELFLVLLLVVIVDKYRSREEKKRVYALYGIFAVSLVASHYSLAFLYLIYLIIAWLLLFLIDNPALRRLQRSAEGAPTDRSTTPHRMLTLVFVLAFAAFTVAWYVSVGAAASIGIGRTLTRIVYVIFTPSAIALAVGIGTAVYLIALALIYVIASRRAHELQPGLSCVSPIALLAALCAIALNNWKTALNDILQIGTQSPLHEIGRALYIVSVFLIAVGLCALAFRCCRRRFDKELVALALASFAVLAAATIVPPLSFIMNATRLFHVSTLLLAPFCVTGALLVPQIAARVIGWRDNASDAYALKIVAAFFVVLFLFNTGFVYEVTHQESTSFILNGDIDAARFNEREVAAGQWLYQVHGKNITGKFLPIYADAHRAALLRSFINDGAYSLQQPPTTTPLIGYVYLGTYNIETGQVAQVQKDTLLQGTTISYASLGTTNAIRSKVFDDGGAAIYYGSAK
jgi:uncharacterized membrane protein